ncbi:hypothetical protein [Paraburkholderia oxyphila]|uniref:hypothetical protein n=1 Tax=Paraburkholderia oxyphila TaxID=614212 RepID=UPI0012EE6608|nr:hypothetical protein [Paraburkholderia oxyphila]
MNSRVSTVFRVAASQDLSESNMLIIDVVVKYEQCPDCQHCYGVRNIVKRMCRLISRLLYLHPDRLAKTLIPAMDADRQLEQRNAIERK